MNWQKLKQLLNARKKKFTRPLEVPKVAVDTQLWAEFLGGKFSISNQTIESLAETNRIIMIAPIY